jgi:hypothetical protein
VLYKVWLVSLTKTYPPEEEDGNVFIEVLLPISTQLTAEELTNPIIRRIQSTMSFREEFKLARENRAEYQYTIERRNAWYRLTFLTPEYKAKRLIELLAHEANF